MDYKDIHWGEKPERLVRVNLWIPDDGRVIEVGKLVEVVYLAKKGVYGEALWRHRFSEPFPFLACDKSGKQLYILGGNYKVTHRGIEG